MYKPRVIVSKLNTNFDSNDHSNIQSRNFTLDITIHKDPFKPPPPGSYNPKYPSVADGAPFPIIRASRCLEEVDHRNVCNSPGPGAYSLRRDFIIPSNSACRKQFKKTTGLPEDDLHLGSPGPGPGSYSPIIQRKGTLSPAVLRSRSPARSRQTIDYHTLEVLQPYLPDPDSKVFFTPSSSPSKLGPGSYFDESSSVTDWSGRTSVVMCPKLIKSTSSSVRSGHSSPGPASYPVTVAFNESPLSPPPKHLKKLPQKSVYLADFKRGKERPVTVHVKSS